MVISISEAARTWATNEYLRKVWHGAYHEYMAHCRKLMAWRVGFTN